MENSGQRTAQFTLKLTPWQILWHYSVKYFSSLFNGLLDEYDVHSQNTKASELTLVG